MVRLGKIFLPARAHFLTFGENIVPSKNRNLAYTFSQGPTWDTINGEIFIFGIFVISCEYRSYEE